MRGLLGDLISQNYEFTLADMEAGLEHLSRSGGTLRHIDTLLVVVEPYRKALETARRTFRLAKDLTIPNIYAVASKVRDEAEAEELRRFTGEVGLELLATVPYDDAVRLADREGAAVIDMAPDSPAVGAIDSLLDSILPGDAVPAKAAAAT